MENNFYSIDRLIEFGMGIAVAQQMVRTMNEAMQNMVVPGAMNPMQVSTPQTYYVAIDGKQSGALFGIRNDAADCQQAD